MKRRLPPRKANGQFKRVGRATKRENPDWAALHEKAKHHGRRAVEGAKKAHAWSKPHAAKAWEHTKAGAKKAHAATKRGAKKAAPHVARGIRSVSERLDRWAAVENPTKRRTRRKGPR